VTERNRPATPALAAAGAAALLVAGCTGVQSALEPAGRGAEDLARLFWWMAGGAIVIWIAVAVLAVYAIRANPDAAKKRTAMLIVWGGAIVPTIILTVLLVYGLRMMPSLLREVPEETLRVAVTGEQWWWRVRYLPPGEEEVVLANEIRLPVGEPVEFLLDSPDVIHSLWIPPLGGKMDMIPGRQTRLVLEPRRTGTFRGACAEYCGDSHALMAFPVVVMEREEFALWLESQRQPAREPTGGIEWEGRARFFASGCPACHTIAGTPARGVVGPDLTHVGSRLTLGAGTLPNDPPSFARWIERTGEVKPGVHMPSFPMLGPEELRAIAAYLESLQ
jgi:cytochrome c oxidase subunit II